MKRYVIKRLLIIIPTIWITSLIVFTLSRFVPQDPVSILLDNRGAEGSEEEIYNQVYLELGLEKPNFYFSILPAHYPDNINSISDPDTKSQLKKALKLGYRYTDIETTLAKTKDNNISLIEQLLKNKSLKKSNLIVPKFVWHGNQNQYHLWLSSFFNGQSIVDGKSALSKVKNGLLWTLSITMVDFILSIILCILIGKYLVVYHNNKRTRWISYILYTVYSIPVFWMATMAVLFFTTDDYGSVTNIFPSVGMNIYPGESTLYHIVHNAHKLILPILILSIHSLAYTTRIMRRSLTEELQKPYVSTAYSKGLSRKQVINRHAFRNALIPMITVFVAAFVSAFAGSLLLEVIFNVPGIGRLLYSSIGQADWNVVFCIVIIIASVTSLIYLIGDILYAIVQPKLRYDA